ncbi:MAG: hypothetical protein R6V73_05060, partial [Anaerolineales bacterium]
RPRHRIARRRPHLRPAFFRQRVVDLTAITAPANRLAVAMWDDLEEWPLRRVLSREGQADFGKTFRYLTGDPVKW